MEVNLCFLFTTVRQDLFCMHAELSHVLMCGVIIYQASMMEQKQEKFGDILVRYRVVDFDMRVNHSCMCFAAAIKGAATCEFVMQKVLVF